MKNIFYTILLMITLGIMGCQKGPYPYIDLKTVKSIDSINHPAVNNVAFIYQGNVYYLPYFGAPVKQITNDGSAQKFVKLSHDHSKFAYQTPQGIITVVDSTGKLLTSLPQYTQVKSFDWSADDKTLYILNNNLMEYYGPSINLPEITYPGIILGSTMEVLSASVSMEGDFAYVIHGYNFIDGDIYKLIIIPAKNGTAIEFDDNDIPYSMDYVSFSTHAQDLILGYQDLTLGTDCQEKISFFTNLNPYPDFSYGGNGSSFYCTPVYNSSLNYMVTGLVVSGNNTLAPAAFYLKDDTANNKILTKYTLSGAGLYTDWK